MRARVAGSMPVPLSVTVSTTCLPGRKPVGNSPSSATTSVRVATSRIPPVGMASLALITRFITTCSSCPAPNSTQPASSAR